MNAPVFIYHRANLLDVMVCVEFGRCSYCYNQVNFHQKQNFDSQKDKLGSCVHRRLKRTIDL